MSSTSQNLGLIALGGFTTLAFLSQRFRQQSSEHSQTLPTCRAISDNPESNEQPVLIQEVSIWPQLTTALSEAISPGLVFKTLDAAALVLRLARNLDARLQAPALDAFYAKLCLVERAGMARWKDFGGTKVVAVEGLSGSGKTTLIQGLTSAASTSRSVGTFEHSAELLAAQAVFAILPEPILKAFEFSTNYFMAFAIQQSGHKVALVERFYHAICAHAVCDGMPAGGPNGEGDFSKIHTSVFDWPVDLPVPDLVIYLSITTELRLKRRRLGGGTSATDRSVERILARDKRIETAYALITGPHTIAIDASGALSETLSATREACEAYKIPVEQESGMSPKRVSLGVYGAWS